MIKAILTGHSQGLGLGIAKSLLARGFPVLGLSRSTSNPLQEQYPRLLTQITIDLACREALEQWLRGSDLPAFTSGADMILLINNAGVVTPIGPLTAQESEDIAHSVALNVAAPLILSAHTSRLLKPGQRLRILHVSSGAGRSPYPGWSVYCAGKAALDMHARACQQDKAEQVTICSLAPGVIDTEMQTRIRHTDEKRFPNRQRFLELKNQGLLSSPEAAGEQVVDYLLAPDFGRNPVDDLRSR